MGSNSNNKAMSREEELQQAAEEWADYYKHAEDLCDYISIRVAYKEGAAWADKHPKNVWHQADEEPQGEYEIICQDEFEHIWLTDRREDIEHYENGWEECAACECIVRWAYISDLLPKGGKEWK